MHRRNLLIVLAVGALCLSYSSLRVQAAAAGDIHHYNVDLKDDFEGAAGRFKPRAVDQPLQGSPEDGQVGGGVGGGVDEFNNYDLEAEVPSSKWSLDDARRRLELSSEETQSFFLSLAMIIVSEIGDKTFLIAAIMAMKHSRLLVFTSALSALAVMTVLSAAFGHAVPNLISRKYTNILAALLFFCFGIRMFIDGWKMTEEEAAHELEEVTQELQEKEDLELLQRAEGGVTDGDSTLTPAAAKKKESSGIVNLLQLIFSPVFVQTFIMTFLAEWGDRSQIATIALAAAHDMVWVSIGGIFGHSLCTGVAVLGGRMLASRISVRTVTLAGAVTFELFALVSLYESLYDHE
ncbi:hypothetical protein DFQ27_004378 [Actinomortierella ambigua]|uniref:GDT1 family protein n=1 Tax=Actinomortierella ambigua TaxID=1343610 RepID=A0A9P6Q272_9FUNG|nr:hypothetical protein DFQ27_004378 [Actinomortierella ambigua]